MAQTIQLTIDEPLILDQDPAQLREKVRAGLLLLAYTNARISLGRFAELMEMSPQEAGSWLVARGIGTLRKLRDPELEAACAVNANELAVALGLPAEPES